MEYEKELLKFQYSLGVDNIFDFITGRDFKKRTYNNSQMMAISSSVNMQPSSVDGGSENVEQGLSSGYESNNHIENAIKNLNKLTTFEALVDEIKNYYGCKLKLHAKNDVIFDGKIDTKIMLIGEAPGETEDIKGNPFCGQSGMLLRKAINYIGL